MHKINDNKLSEIFGTSPFPNPIIEAELVEENPVAVIHNDEEPVQQDSELDYDIELARTNIHDAIESAKEVLESAAKVAIDTEHPKVYESYSALLKSVTDASTALINIHVQKKTIQKADTKKEESGNVTNNNNTAVFVGTPAELGRLLKQQIKE